MPSVGVGQSLITTSRLPGMQGWLNVQQYGISPNNTATANTAALNALVGSSGTAPAGSTIYFPGGTYAFNGAVTIASTYLFQGCGVNYTGGVTILSFGTAVSGFLTIAANIWYGQFRDITFLCTTAQTSGAAITSGNNVGISFYRCTFVSGSSSTCWYDCIDYSGGNQSGNTSFVEDCNIQQFTHYGVYSTGNLGTPLITGCLIQGQYGTTSQTAAACIAITQGAMQIDNSDIIGAVNNLLAIPTSGLVIASIFCTNTYFDYANGSCIKITGAGATVRCLFSGCSFTTSNVSTGLTAVEISTTVAAGAQGIRFEFCNIYNTFGTTGTTNGFLITGAADVTIENCNIAGWTNGVQVTPNAGTAGSTLVAIWNNTIGPSGGYGANGTGIVLNVGTVAYGGILIQNNALQNNTTTAITNSATAPTSTTAGNFRISGNAGYNPHGAVTTPTIASATTFTNTTMLPVMVLLKAGTTAPTVLVVNGVTSAVLPLISQIVTIPLEPGGTISFTYTVAPTWQWIGS